MADLPNLAKLDYLSRINRSIDYIQANLTEPLNLSSVAEVAAFSPFHFHRIFKGLAGETLNSFVKRLRLERALYLMSHKSHQSLTEIALECGFSSSSDFSRCFSTRFGVPPKAFDLQTHRISNRKTLNIKHLPSGSNPENFSVTIKTLPSRKMAYTRVFKPFEGDRVLAASQNLIQWVKSKALTEIRWYGYMWEDPEIVPLDKCRYDVAVELQEPFATQGELGSIEFPDMTVAEIEIKGPIDLEQRAIDYLYFTWLPRSGYTPDNQPLFEAWNERPFAHGDQHFELNLQLPVTPL